MNAATYGIIGGVLCLMCSIFVIAMVVHNVRKRKNRPWTDIDDEEAVVTKTVQPAGQKKDGMKTSPRLSSGASGTKTQLSKETPVFHSIKPYLETLNEGSGDVQMAKDSGSTVGYGSSGRVVVTTPSSELVVDSEDSEEDSSDSASLNISQLDVTSENFQTPAGEYDWSLGETNRILFAGLPSRRRSLSEGVSSHGLMGAQWSEKCTSEGDISVGSLDGTGSVGLSQESLKYHTAGSISNDSLPMQRSPEDDLETDSTQEFYREDIGMGSQDSINDFISERYGNPKGVEIPVIWDELSEEKSSRTESGAGANSESFHFQGTRDEKFSGHLNRRNKQWSMQLLSSDDYHLSQEEDTSRQEMQMSGGSRVQVSHRIQSRQLEDILEGRDVVVQKESREKDKGITSEVGSEDVATCKGIDISSVSVDADTMGTSVDSSGEEDNFNSTLQGDKDFQSSVYELKSSENETDQDTSQGKETANPLNSSNNSWNRVKRPPSPPDPLYDNQDGDGSAFGSTAPKLSPSEETSFDFMTSSAEKGDSGSTSPDRHMDEKELDIQIGQ